MNASRATSGAPSVVLALCCGCSFDSTSEQLHHVSEETTSSATSSSSASRTTGGEREAASTGTSAALVATTAEPSLGTVSGSSGGGCAEVQVLLERVTPTMVLLVDRSNSMSAPLGRGPSSRWDAVYEALMNPNFGVVGLFDDEVRFGLTLYTRSTSTCPEIGAVAPALDNRDAIDTVFASAFPGAGTPTAAALSVTADALAASELEGPKAILLTTAGEPHLCGVFSLPQGRAAALEATRRAFALGIRTYVVGFGEDTEHLQELANVGAGNDSEAPEPPLYVGTNPAELVFAYDAILAELTGCEWVLQTPVPSEHRCSGTIALDGQALQCGVDYELTDERTLVVLGAACDVLKGGGQHELTASFPCDAV